MPNRLLEIGAGDNPAIQNPGTIFSAEDIDYLAIDAKRISTMVVYDRYEPLSNEYYDTACIGAMSALPYKNEAFRRVIMKSVIGEYSLSFLRTKDPQTQGIRSRQTLAETLEGFSEVFRVLEPGGQVVISEEDTPADHTQLVRRLSKVGFSGLTTIPYNQRLFQPGLGRYDQRSDIFPTWDMPEPSFSHADQNWLNARGTYWGLRNRNDPLARLGRVNHVAENYYEHSYILTACKPANENQIDVADTGRGVLLASAHQAYAQL